MQRNMIARSTGGQRNLAEIQNGRGTCRATAEWEHPQERMCAVPASWRLANLWQAWSRQPVQFSEVHPGLQRRKTSPLVAREHWPLLPHAPWSLSPTTGKNQEQQSCASHWQLYLTQILLPLLKSGCAYDVGTDL